jgi:hypothetical protein
MKYLTIFFLCLIISCSNDKREFALYDVDLMKDAYKTNRIKGFVKTYIVDGKTYKIDSTVLNDRGKIKNVFRLMAFGGADTLKYDSMDRLVADSHGSDVWRDFEIKYKEIPDDEKVVQRWIDVTDNDSILAYEYTIKYNSNLDTIQSISTRMIGDTTLTIKYRYQNNRLAEIGPDNAGISSKYVYKPSGQLDLVVKYHKSRPFEVEFVSNKTGLIDSVLMVSDTTNSLDFRTLDFKKYKFKREDMIYYSYFK